jgi:hypothetical protein
MSKKAEKEKPKLEIVQPTKEAEKETDSSQDFGQPVNQKLVNQLTSAVNQKDLDLVNQNQDSLDNQLTRNETYLVNQKYDEKMFRSRKQRKLKGIRLPIQKLLKYEAWCFANKIDFQDAVEYAMDWIIGQPNAANFGQPVNHVLIDDLDDKKLTDEILIFYQKWTGNKIKPKDRSAREEVKRFSDDVCKIGILTAILRAKNKINSFGYCVPVIEEVAELPEIGSNYVEYLQQTVLSVRKG